MKLTQEGYENTLDFRDIIRPLKKQLESGEISQDVYNVNYQRAKRNCGYQQGLIQRNKEEDKVKLISMICKKLINPSNRISSTGDSIWTSQSVLQAFTSVTLAVLVRMVGAIIESVSSKLEIFKILIFFKKSSKWNQNANDCFSYNWQRWWRVKELWLGDSCRLWYKRLGLLNFFIWSYCSN